MLFNSFAFIAIFFPVVTLLYYLLPHRFRWALLLVASGYFYMAFVPKYILILISLIIIDYASAIAMEKTQGNKRKAFLWFSLLSNVGMLSFFKYFNFVNENVGTLAKLIGWNYSISNIAFLLPIGLSFHTFQSMSYIIEVYRGDQKAERHLGIYALYVMFYPQLVAGPIERPQNLIHQFKEKAVFNYPQFCQGLRLIIWGLFKKVFVADRLAVYVDSVYQDPAHFSGWSFPYWIATYFFMFEIYCDFSGYSQIAQGTAKVMGIELMENFNYPLISKSIAEFWTRWHISLSTWFKDYIYTPLAYKAMNSQRKERLEYQLYAFVLLIFFISGLWHGAGWNFVIFGAIHGIYIVMSSVLKPIRKRGHDFLRMGSYPRVRNALKILTVFHLALFAWVFFRAKSLAESLLILSNIFGGKLYLARSLNELARNEALQGGLVTIILFLLLETIFKASKRLEEKTWVGISWPQFYYAFLLALIVVVAPLANKVFIYFQF